MTVVVARHGQTAWNAEGRFQGMGDPPLDQIGERQAEVLAEEVAPLRPVWVATSDLRRARRTAEVVAAACGVHLTVDEALREVDLGSWEGLTRAEVAASHPVEWRRWCAGEDVERGGGETRAEAGERCAAALRRLAATLPAAATGVVVAHGIVLQAAMSALAAAGAVVAPGLPGGAGEAPHLPNGGWLALEVRTPPG